jgi:hypothetical protein
VHTHSWPFRANLRGVSAARLASRKSASSPFTGAWWLGSILIDAVLLALMGGKVGDVAAAIAGSVRI